MPSIRRRQFLKLAGSAAAFAAVPRALSAAIAPPRVVVVGAGFGGATAAKYLRLWGGDVDVTLVEPNAQHVSCILSNLVVTGALGMDRITLGYDSLRTARGVRVMQGLARAIDPAARTVEVDTGAGVSTLEWDHLVLAPGVDFLAPAGAWNPELTPHAWKAGAQTTLLRDQLQAMPDGGLVVLRIPKAPYRCPPGPYERACAIAEVLQRSKPRAKLLVLDGNPGITAEPATFERAFSELYGGLLEYHAGVSVSEIDSAAHTLATSVGPLAADVINFIPDHQAGAIVREAGLATDPTGRWAPVSPRSYATPAWPEVHVIGDSQATGQPKSGHMANAQAKVCADAIVRALQGLPADPQPVTSSACFSPVAPGLASWLHASFRYDPTSDSMARIAESFGEAEAWSAEHYEQMFEWADTLFGDSFR
jgi:NADPH-dependent 2,4-dienoyl-CoA reductase/sulfur reductase-like enzyme